MQPTLIEAPIRISVKANKREDIQNYGDGNVYPQVIRNAFDASGRATQCIETFEDFVLGLGLPDPISKTIVNFRKKMTAQKLLTKLVKDYARFFGFAIHFNFNALGEIVSMDHIPFEELRLGIENDDGEVTEVVHNPDWGGERDRFRKEKTKRYKLFNPDPDIVQRQADQAGGFEVYTGQILWWSKEGNWKYPKASCDPVLEDVLADTESKEYRYSNILTGFMNPTLVEAPPFENEVDRDNFKENIRLVQGGRNAAKVIFAEKKNNGESSFDVKQLAVNSGDGNFEKTEQSTKDAIRSRYKIPGILACDLIAGKLGGSQEIKDATIYYNGITAKHRAVFEDVLTEVFTHWKDPIVPTGGIQILPLEFQFPETQNTNPANPGNINNTNPANQ